MGLGAYFEEVLREVALKGALGWDSQDTRSCGPDRRTSIVSPRVTDYPEVSIREKALLSA